MYVVFEMILVRLVYCCLYFKEKETEVTIR